MTREAKVGLLLGLVFIVAIAMVLRGIHQSGQSEMVETGLTETYAEKPAENPLSDVVNLSVAVNKLSDPGQAATLPAQTPAPAANPESQPRYVQVLPSTNISSPSAGAETPATVPAVLTTAAEAPADSQPVREPAPAAAPVVVEPPSGAIDRALEQVTTPVPSASILHGAQVVVNPRAGKVYDVKQGDSLTTIAQKMYGTEEGKKKSNIDRIYAANKDNMKSADDLWIGQKLTIPDLPRSDAPSLASAAKPADTAKPAESSKPASSTRTYVVKEKDSLWKIAQKELGNGSRYKEIEKLNAKTLKNGKGVSAGMKLILPAQ